MKSFKFLMMLMALCLSAGMLYAQEHSDVIEKSISLANEPENELLIKNINGSVKVEGYSGNTIEVVARRKIEARSEEKLQQGMADIQLGVKEEGGTVVIYLEAPFAELKSGNGGWNYGVHQNNIGYEFELELELKVPDRLRLAVSTVNGEVVKVRNFAGPLKASNVNGAVELEQVSGNSSAKTVNGNIVANMRSIPQAETEYETVNGDIKVFFPSSLAADIDFNILNGDFYTDFEDVAHKGRSLEKGESRGGKAKVYRVGKKSLLSINGGGNQLQLKTISGDIYLQKQN